MKTIVDDWKLIPYSQAWERQEKLFDEVVAAKAAGTSYVNRIVLCEHPHTYTWGRSGKERDMLLCDEQLQAIGATY